MKRPKRAKKGFTFYTFLNLVELVGKNAKDIKELVSILEEVEGSSIFYHTHQAFLEHHYALSDYPHDFAYWVSNCLQDKALGEKLSIININEYTNIRSLRNALVDTIKDYIAKDRRRIRSVPRGQEFHFCKSISMATSTNYTVWNLEEFCEGLEKVGIYSLYYHFFVARLRLEKNTNDFSHWIEDSLENKKLANKIAKLNPYMYTLDQLKERIIGEIRLELELEKDA